MKWLSDVTNAKQLVSECIDMEQIRFGIHFDAMLKEHNLRRFAVLKQLKRSQRAKKYDYTKGNDKIPCYCFIADETEGYVALTFFVSFTKEYTGIIQMRMQEFHP